VTKKRALVLAAVAIMVTGCTGAQRYVIDVGQRAQATLGPFKACQRVIEAKPEYALVYQKLAVSTADDPFREPTAAQLSDPAIIAEPGISLYLTWFSEQEACGLPTMQELGQLAPEFEI
jgi:hypothetical protein